MRLTYQELYEIITQAKRQAKDDFENFELESDLKTIAKCEELYDFITNCITIEFELKRLNEDE